MDEFMLQLLLNAKGPQPGDAPTAPVHTTPTPELVQPMQRPEVGAAPPSEFSPGMLPLEWRGKSTNYEPPAVDLKQFHSDWLDKAAALVTGAGAAMQPGAFRTAKNREAASIIQSILGGVGALGGARTEERKKGVEQENLTKLERFRSTDAAQRGVYGDLMGRAGQKALDLAYRPAELRQQNAAELEKEKQMMPLRLQLEGGLLKLRGDSELSYAEKMLRQRLRTGELVQRNGQVFQPGEFERMLDASNTREITDRLNNYGLVPRNVEAALDNARANLQQLRMMKTSPNAFSSDPAMKAEMARVDRQITEELLRIQGLNKQAREAAMARMDIVPESDRGAMKMLIEGLYGDEAERMAERMSVGTSWLNSESDWSKSSKDMRVDELKSLLGSATTTSDPATAVNALALATRRIKSDASLVKNPELEALLLRLTDHVGRITQPAAPATPAPGTTMPTRAPVGATTPSLILGEDDPELDKEAQ